jgi:protein phosphatase-4 regulatory subunit 3
MATQRSVKRRVKVYFLGADGLWQDAGTGFVSVVYSESIQETFFLVKSDVNESETILESRIAQTDIYQRQQGLRLFFFFCWLGCRVFSSWSSLDTLIVWQEPETNRDIALSFQEPAGCVEVW